MINKKCFAAIITTLAVSTSCVYTEMHHFEEDDIKWLSVYNEEDSVLFTSSDGRYTDTLVVKQKGKYDTYLPFMRNEVSSRMEAYGYLDCKLIHANIKLYTSIKKVKDDVLEVSFSFDKMHLKTELGSNPILNSVEINNVLYDDVLILNDSTSFVINSYSAICEYVIWSKSRGLLQYKYINGDVYTLSGKLNP